MENNLAKPTHIVINKTPYFETSPQQGWPPEGKLKKGTQITIIEPSLSQGYTRVKTEDGSVIGYVASSDIASIGKLSKK
ncbi:hypothetical protein [Spirosoma flavum]|uniref:SH3 domain-containing protein n=1 Tax=Spirosoma flavum TaxID=2048557 RepID=A0ABW6AJL6_9BACT